MVEKGSAAMVSVMLFMVVTVQLSSSVSMALMDGNQRNAHQSMLPHMSR